MTRLFILWYRLKKMTKQEISMSNYAAFIRWSPGMHMCVDNKPLPDPLPIYCSYCQQDELAIFIDSNAVFQRRSFSPGLSVLISYKTMLALHVTTLWLNDATWRHRSGLKLAQVMTCCLSAQNHDLNHCWPIISELLWYSSSLISGWFENWFKVTNVLWGQCVNTNFQCQ